MATTVLLRDVVEADLPIFFEQQLDPVATAMADFPSRDEAAFMTHWHKIMADPAGMIKTIVFDGRVAGNIVSWDAHGKREVGYWLGRDFWGKGIATQALASFLTHETTRPLHAFVVKHNAGSRRVLEKCGFKLIAEDADGYTLRL